MHVHDILVLALLASPTAGHGLITLIRGANGVDMPGLSVADGTPRDCSTNRCGSQADTAIIRDRDMRSGRAGPLGRTQGAGPVDAAVMVARFMGTGAGVNAASASTAAARSGTGNDTDLGFVGVQDDDEEEEGEDDLSALGLRARGAVGDGGVRNVARQFLNRLFGGGGGGGRGGEPAAAAVEGNVAAMAGLGATAGLPTCADDGTIEMVFHQVNQDGAGPLDASVDGTSGGTDPAAFQRATVTQDVPGFGFQGLSLATSRDFPLRVQMPAGMTCDATVAGVNNVCVVRVRNGAAAGPFGGSAAFTMSPAARKRAIEYRKRKRAQVFKA